MALGDSVQRSRLIPNENGKGNKVYLDELPYIREGEGNQLRSIIFPFVDPEQDAIFEGSVIDYNLASDKKQRGYGTARLVHLYGALMTPENYDKLVTVDDELPLQEVIDFCNGLIAEDATDIELTVLFAYTKAGYGKLPPVGDVISSKYKPKTLAYSPKSKLFLTPPADSPDSESGDSNVL